VITCWLPLAELELLACFWTAGLLALDCTCIAREQSQIAQLAAVTLVDFHEGARDREPESSCLSGESTALDLGANVVTSKRVSRRERLLNCGDVRRAREVVAQGASIDQPFSRTGLQVQSADRFLAASNRVR